MPTDNTPPKAALSKERIVDAAYKLAKEDPVNALSMRKVAGVLDVTPMAIYKYFDDKNQLTAAVIDRHLTESDLVPDAVDYPEWRHWITESYLRLWDAFDQSPGMIHYMTNATSLGPAVLSWQNEILKVLINAGLTPKQALNGHTTMSELAIGNSIMVPLRNRGLETLFPSIWEDLQAGKVPDLNQLNQSDIPLVDYPWVLMTGQAMMEELQNSRKAFYTELCLVLDSLENHIVVNNKGSIDY